MPRVYGAGTIEKRKTTKGTTYRVRFNLGVNPRTGERRFSPWRSGFPNKDMAIKAAAEYRKELEGGLKVEADSMTFAKWADSFHVQRELQGSLSKATIDLERQQIAHLNKSLGDMLIREIDSGVVKNMLAQMGKDGKSQSAISRSYRVLNQILKDAYLNDIILKNPCDKVKAPKQRKKEITYLSKEELALLLGALDKEEARADELWDTTRKTKPRREHAFTKNKVRATLLRSECMGVRLALATGARRGEILGREWRDVDFDEGLLRITRKTKNDESIRTISLDDDILARLKIHKAHLAECLIGQGIQLTRNTPIVMNEFGEFVHEENFSRWWRDLRDSIGLGHIRFHDLRHTQATLLITMGVDIKTVQSRLGHSLASTTLDLYAGIIPARDKEAANLIGELIKSGSSKGEVIAI